MSAHGLMSVTVTAPDLGTADAWATAIFAFGEDGPDLFADAPAGLEAFVVRDGQTTFQSAGFPSVTERHRIARASRAGYLITRRNAVA